MYGTWSVFPRAVHIDHNFAAKIELRPRKMQIWRSGGHPRGVLEIAEWISPGLLGMGMNGDLVWIANDLRNVVVLKSSNLVLARVRYRRSTAASSKSGFQPQ